MSGFEDFLIQKRIDPQAFRMARSEEFAQYAFLFEKMGAKSFDHQKKFYFNLLRKEFLLAQIPEIAKVAPTTQKPVKPAGPVTKAPPMKRKPVMKPAKSDSKTSAVPPGIKPPKKGLGKPIMKPPGSEAKSSSAPSGMKPPKKKLGKPVMKPATSEEKSSSAPAGMKPPKKKLGKPLMKPLPPNKDSSTDA
ncbi:MAG: hypothetical protein AAGI38_05550 [Bacteroidota bacterium]